MLFAKQAQKLCVMNEYIWAFALLIKSKVTALRTITLNAKNHVRTDKANDSNFAVKKNQVQ
mgnify:CR=1 FL=1